MFTAIIILIILVCFVLVLAVLIQNPKGGGLSASFGGMGNQVMGARKATDFIEKTTWVLAVTLLVLTLLSGAALPDATTSNTNEFDKSLMKVETPPPTPPSTDPNTTPAGPQPE